MGIDICSDCAIFCNPKTTVFSDPRKNRSLPGEVMSWKTTYKAPGSLKERELGSWVFVKTCPKTATWQNTICERRLLFVMWAQYGRCREHPHPVLLFRFWDFPSWKPIPFWSRFVGETNYIFLKSCHRSHQLFNVNKCGCTYISNKETLLHVP